MLILSINEVLNWVQIVADNGRKYTCPMKKIGDELFFNFKKQDHKVADYVSSLTRIFKSKG